MTRYNLAMRRRCDLEQKSVDKTKFTVSVSISSIAVAARSTTLQSPLARMSLTPNLLLRTQGSNTHPVGICFTHKFRFHRGLAGESVQSDRNGFRRRLPVPFVAAV